MLRDKLEMAARAGGYSKSTLNMGSRDPDLSYKTDDFEQVP